MTAYQRRKAEIAYLLKRSKRIEEIALAYATELVRAGVGIPLSSRGICGDEPLDDITSGDFEFRIVTAAHSLAAR